MRERRRRDLLLLFGKNLLRNLVGGSVRWSKFFLFASLGRRVRGEVCGLFLEKGESNDRTCV